MEVSQKDWPLLDSPKGVFFCQRENPSFNGGTMGEKDK